MAKKKKLKGGSGLSRENAGSIKEAAAGILERLPTDEAGQVFESAASGLVGLESELVEELGRTQTVEVLNFLYGLLGDSRVKKAAKRAIYRLEQAGLTADASAKPVRDTLIKPRPKTVPLGFLSAYDSEGLRIGVLALPDPASGFQTAVFTANQVEGLSEFITADISAGNLRRMVAGLGNEGMAPPVEIPAAAARFALSEAVSLALARGKAMNQGYEAFILRIRNVPLPERPLIYDKISVDEAVGKVDLHKSAPSILSHGFFDGFMFSEELLPYLQKFDEADSTVLVLNTIQKEERFQAILEEAEVALFPPERRAVLKRQLEETALLLWELGERQTAEETLAAAIDLDRPAGPGVFYPIIRSIVMASLALFYEAVGEDDDEDEEEETVTAGGLILPRGYKE